MNQESTQAKNLIEGDDHGSPAWGQDEFEQAVAETLISMFETKIKKIRGVPDNSRLTEEKLRAIRMFGPYIPSGERYIENVKEEGMIIDVVNDPIPSVGCYSHGYVGGKSADVYDGYANHHFFQEVPSLPKDRKKMGAGRTFRIITASAENTHIKGCCDYFTVSKSGKVVACDTVVTSSIRGTPGEKTRFFSEYETDPNRVYQIALSAYVAMQFHNDRRFCWQIKAEESNAKAYLGCGINEVKSLLYARTLPQTDTGRKRPILHLVAAHQRRIKNGTDINVTAFLRGVQVVEIGGTRFTVLPPRVMRDRISENSEKYRREIVA